MAEIYLNSNYTVQELNALRESGKIAFTTLAEAQDYAKESDGNDTIIFTGGTYAAVADLSGVSYQIDGNISVNSISTSSVTVNLAGENFDSSKAAITYTGNPYDEEGKLILDYGFVNVIGGTANAGGYIKGRDLYVQNNVFYNDNSDAAIPESGATVTVDIGGATFNAVYEANLFRYTGPKAETDLWTLSNTTAKNGVVVYTGNAGYDLTGATNSNIKTDGNVFVNGTNITAGNYFYLFRNGNTCNRYDVAIHNATIKPMIYLAYGVTAFNAQMNVTITDSNITQAIKIGGNTMIFNNGINIVVTGSTIAGLNGGSGKQSQYNGDVNYKFVNCRVTGEINTYIQNSTENFTNEIDGNVNYEFEGSTVSETVYGGLRSNDTVASSYKITGDVTISVKGGYVKTIYATSARSEKCINYNVDGDINVSIDGGSVGTLYGNREADVAGDVNVTLKNGAAVNVLVGFSNEAGSVNGQNGVILSVAGESNTVKKLSGFNTISIDANANLTITETFVHTGVIQITGDMMNFNKVLDAADTTEYNNVSVTAENTAYFISSGNIIAYSTAAKSQDVVYFDSSLNGCTTGQMIAENVYYGVNAFNSIDTALSKMADKGTLVIAGDVEINDWTGITNVIVKNGATITTDKWSDAISLTVDLTGVAERAKIIDWTGGTAFDYGRVNIIGGTNAGGYIDARDLYVRNKVYYNDKTVTVNANGSTLNSGDTVLVNIGGATFAAVYDTNFFNYGDPVDKTDLSLGNLSQDVAETGGIVVYTGGTYNLTVISNDFSPAGNVVFNNAQFTATSKGNVFLIRNVTTVSSYDCAVYNLTTSNCNLYLAHNAKSFNTTMRVTIADSNLAGIFIGSSNMVFKDGIDVTLINTISGSLSGTSAAYTDITGDVKYTLIDSTINGEVHSYFSSSNYPNKNHTINGNVIYYFENSKISKIYGGLKVQDKIENGYEITGDVTITLKGGSADTIMATQQRTANTTYYKIGGNISVNIDGSTVKNLYASQEADVAGNVTVNLSNGADVTTLVGNEGYGDTDNVTGNVILNVSGTGNIVKNISCFDIVTIDAAASLTVTGNFAHTGDIKITGTAMSLNKVIDAASSTVYGKIDADGTSFFINDGDLFAYSTAAHSQDTVYFNSGYSGNTGDKVGENAYFGVNAFNTLEAAQNALSAEGTLNILSALNGGTNRFEDIEIGSNLFGASADGNVESVDLSISGATTQAVLGGGSSSGSKVGTDSAEGFVGGTINLTLTDSNVGTVYGGGYSSMAGNIALTIIDTICNKIVYGGNVTNTGSLTDNTESTESTIGDVALTINGGEFKDKVVGGSRVVASENSPVNVTTKVGNVTLNIDGGHFADSIFGAGYILGNKNDDGNESNAQLKVAGVTMTLNGAEVADIAGKNADGIYAGGLAARGANITVGTAQTRSAGSSAVNITVNSGKYTSIYGGGWAESGAKVTVYGVSINVTGGEIANLYGGGNNDQSGARTNVDGDVLITISGGTIGNVCAGAKFVTSKVKGSSTVRINGEAEIGNLCGLSNNNYDGVLYDQTLDVDAALSCNSISGFDKIDIAAAIDVAGNVDMFGKGIVNIDLTGFTAEADAEWTVLSAAELNNLEAVTFGTAEVVSEVNKWSCGAYTLTFNDNAEGDDTLVLKYTKQLA